MFKTTIHKTVSNDLIRLNNVKTRLKEHKHFFNSGIWMVDVRCACKIGGEKGTHQLKNAVSPPLPLFNKKLYNLLYKLTGLSFFVWVKNKTEQEYKIDLVFISRCNTIKFFDIKNGWVLTYYPSPPPTTQDIKIKHSIFFRLFKTIEANFISIKGIQYKKEKYIAAPLLTFHPDINKYTLEIFNRYEKYIQTSKGITQPSLFLGCILYLESMISDPSFKDFIKHHRSGIVDIDQTMVYYPSHGDFNSDNILIHEDEIIVIDLEEFGALLPGFFDLMYLCNAIHIKKAYKIAPYLDPFVTCVKESFLDKKVLSFEFLKFIHWVFYHSIFYRQTLNLSVENSDNLNKSWKSLLTKHLSDINLQIPI